MTLIINVGFILNWTPHHRYVSFAELRSLLLLIKTSASVLVVFETVLNKMPVVVKQLTFYMAL